MDILCMNGKSSYRFWGRGLYPTLYPMRKVVKLNEIELKWKQYCSMSQINNDISHEGPQIDIR